MSFVKHLGSRSRFTFATLMVGLIGALAGCAEPTAPTAASTTVVPSTASPLLGLTTSPTPLRFRRGAPALEQTSMSFYAKKGVTKSVSLYFKTAHGARGNEYARLVIPAAALSQRPNGTPIAWGDSVRITVSAPDPSRLLLRMEPHGLKFDSRSPARLTMRYNEADPDYNGDGHVNLIDSLLELRLAIWRQPTLFDLFARLASVLDRSLASVSSDLPGFSQYIIAY